MNKIILSVAQKHGYANIIMGAGFFSLLFFELIGGASSRFVGVVTNFLCSLVVVTSFLMKSELDDERSKTNLMKAGQFSFLLTLAILAFLTLILVIFEDIKMDTTTVLRALIGIGYTLYGASFLYLEKVGE